MQLGARREDRDRAERLTYDDLKARHGDNWGLSSGTTDQERAAAAARRREILEEANRRTFEAECKAADVDPAGGISPTLRKLLAAAT